MCQNVTDSDQSKDRGGRSLVKGPNNYWTRNALLFSAAADSSSLPSPQLVSSSSTFVRGPQPLPELYNITNPEDVVLVGTVSRSMPVDCYKTFHLTVILKSVRRVGTGLYLCRWLLMPISRTWTETSVEGYYDKQTNFGKAVKVNM